MTAPRYADLVEETKRLLNRSERDSWKVAENTWTAVKVKGKTQREWAEAIGRSPMTVNVWLKIWNEYVHISVQERPTFHEAMLQMQANQGGRTLEEERERVRGLQVKSALNNLPADAAARVVAKVIQDRPEIAQGVVQDAQAQGALARAEQDLVSPPRSRSTQREIADELDLDHMLYKARKTLIQALAEASSRRLGNRQKEDLLYELDRVQTVLEGFQAFLHSGDRSWEDVVAEWEKEGAA